MLQRAMPGGSGAGSELDITKLKAVMWIQKDTQASQNYTIPNNVKLIVVMGGYGINSYNGTDVKVNNTNTLYLTKVGEELSHANGHSTTTTDYARWTNQTTLTLRRANGTGGAITAICFAEI